jgi:probable rRNA maturation factor
MARGKLEIAVRVEARGWRTAWPQAANETRRFLTAVAGRPELKIPSGAEIAVILADDDRLQALNAQFRGKDRPTNVLSFPDTTMPLGGMAVAYETVRREAGLQGKQFINHAKHMILHGFLHLLDYDHQTSREARLMERLETAILSQMGIPNPYILRTKTRA